MRVIKQLGKPGAQALVQWRWPGRYGEFETGGLRRHGRAMDP